MLFEFASCAFVFSCVCVPIYMCSCFFVCFLSVCDCVFVSVQ